MLVCLSLLQWCLWLLCKSASILLCFVSFRLKHKNREKNPDKKYWYLFYQVQWTSAWIRISLPTVLLSRTIFIKIDFDTCIFLLQAIMYRAWVQLYRKIMYQVMCTHYVCRTQCIFIHRLMTPKNCLFLSSFLLLIFYHKRDTHNAELCCSIVYHIASYCIALHCITWLRSIAFLHHIALNLIASWMALHHIFTHYIITLHTLHCILLYCIAIDHYHRIA